MLLALRREGSIAFTPAPANMLGSVALVRLAGEPRAVGDVFNIGSMNEVTIRDLAERVKKMTASESPILTVPYDVAYEEGFEDMPRRVPDISKIQSLIGFEPKLGLDDIIRSVVEHVRQR